MSLAWTRPRAIRSSDYSNRDEWVPGSRCKEDNNRYVQLSPRDPTASNTFTSLDLGSIRLHLASYSTGIQIRTPRPARRSLIGLLLKRSGSVRQFGTEITERDIVLAPDGELDVFALGPSTFLWIQLERRLFDTLVSEANLPAFEQTSAFDCGHYADAARNLCQTAFRLNVSGALMPDPKCFEDLVWDALIHALGFAEPHTLRQTDRDRYVITTRAEAFMWEHVDAPNGLKSIAGSVERSPRALLTYFQQFYGVGPVGYFRIQRLNAVRDVLAHDSLEREITRVALDFGFWHLGRFSGVYRTFFGESPRQTRLLRSQVVSSRNF